MSNRNIVLSDNFSKEDWLNFFNTHSDYFTTIDKTSINYQDDDFEQIINLGKIDLPDNNMVTVFMLKSNQSLNQRSYRKKQYNKAVAILKNEWAQAGLFVFYDNYHSFRLSLVYPVYIGKKKEFSSYKRFSYYISKDTPYHTYEQQLSKAKFNDLQSIKDGFKVEPVTSEFFNEVAIKFLELVGGERKNGKGIVEYSGSLELPENDSKVKKEFAVRLLGRLIFCWFLKMKKSSKQLSIIPGDFLSTTAVQDNDERSYYHNTIEPLFFEVLNKKKESRKDYFRNENWDKIPFLNGGLFEPDKMDFYAPTDYGRSVYVNTVKIPNKWFYDLFEVFERYNFTVDESTSLDIEIAVDPEMLGKIFENLLAEIDEETGKTARKKTGSFYTPREVVEYIVNTSLYNYLVNHTSVDKSKLQHLIESPETTPEIAKEDVNCILNIISSIKIIDPACGSGAFLMGAMHKMIEIIRVLDPNSYFWKEKIVSNIKDSVFSQYIKEKLKSENIYYIIKLGLLRDNLYGVDIQPMAIELTKLRFFLSLIVDETIVDEKDNRGILALPNLDFKFIAADYLLDLPTLKNKEVFYSSELKELKDIIDYYFTSYGEDKDQVKQRFINKKREFNNKFALSGNLTPDFVTILNWNPFSRESVDWFNPSWMFGMKESFNIIIANPPYVSNKNVDKIKKTLYKEKYGISDDLYNYFFLRSLDLLKPGGILSFISSDTYLSINSKQNLRTAFLENRIIEIFKINNPFENTMVSPAIITIQKDDVRKDYELVFKIAESQEEFFAKEKYQINSLVYKKTAFNTFFPPTKFNNMVWEKYGAKVNQLINKYWFMINSSDNIAKNSEFLEHYRKNLQPGDLTLLGLITDGGQGLATSDNGRFVGVREKTKEASRIKQTRPQKLYEAVKNNKIKELNINSLQDAKTRLADMTELQIRELFFRLKKVYGRDIFGVGYLFQIISESEIADPAYMTEEEKNEGIAAYKPHFVPYDKGDKGGNRWYLDTPFCLDWSKETVNFFISNSGKKGKGMPVVRNKEFYFHEGFCWSDVSKIIKCRLKGMSVHDVTSMSLFTLIPGIPNWFFVCILNSNFISEYVNSFINNTQHFQINDARQVPIIIPSPEQLNIFQQIFNEAYKIKIKQFSGELSKYQADQELKVVEERLDKYVLKYYDLE